MTEESKLNLPGSGYDVVSKILHAYALCGDKSISLDDVATKAGMNRTLISKNNGFLASLGLITGGKLKILTPEGKKLALALGHDLDEDSAQAWKQILLSAPAAESILDMIKVQKSIDVNILPAKIASTLGVPDSSMTRTGTKTLIEILMTCGLLMESDGKYLLASGEVTPSQKVSKHVETSSSELSTTVELDINASGSEKESPHVKVQGAIPIHVNIELHLPASSEQSVYDAIFKSIRENLLS